jgi:DNA-binding MarR family transcriptional regulator
MLAQPQNQDLLERQLRQLITYFNLLAQRLMVQRPLTSGSEIEVSRQETRAMIVLGRTGPTTMSELARTLNLALSTATNTIDKLVVKELVGRSRVDDDRRIVQVDLSEKGERLYQYFLDCQAAMGRSMLEGLSLGEREIFLELMAKMTRPPQGTVEHELEHSSTAE